MPNPYSAGAAFPDMSPTINNFVDNLVRLKTHQEDIDQRGRQLQETTRQHNVSSFGTETPTPGMLTIPERQIAETAKLREIERAKLTPDQGAFTPVQEAQGKVSIKTATGLGPSIDKIFSEHITPFSQDPTMTRGNLYDHIASQGKETVTGWLNEIQADYEKNLAKDPNYAKTQQGKQAEALMNDLYNAPDGSMIAASIMPDVARYRKVQEAEKQKVGMDQIKAAIATKAMKGETLTEDEKALVGITPKVPQIRSVDRGDVVDIYENGVLTKTEKKGKAPATLDRERITSNIGVNPATGKEEYLLTDGSFSGRTPGTKATSETELRAQRKEMADNESKLLLNKTSQGAGPLADLHNERSEKPYVYRWSPGELYGGEYVQIKLPKIKGKQVTAKDVYDTASQRGMTYDEVLEAIGVNQ